MEKQNDLILKNGETKITDEQGNVLLQISLTSNMVVVRGVDGTTLLRSWRDILKFWAPPLQPPFEASQAPWHVETAEEREQKVREIVNQPGGYGSKSIQAQPPEGE